VIGELYEAQTGRLIVARVVGADTLAARTAGFLGRTRIDDDEAMWFDRCSGVHTLAMRVPIDVVLVDRSGVVLDVAEAVKPWRFWVGRTGAHSVLEMAAGNARRRGVTSGTILEMRWRSRT
jgi:uncharacterized protein